MDFHYNSNDLIARAARILTSKTIPLLALLSTKVDGSVKWYTTSSFIDYTGLWRASVNKTLQEYLHLGWVEHVTIEQVPVVDGEGEPGKFRKRNLWRLSDEEIGLEFLFNSSLDDDMMDLGTVVLNRDGYVEEAKIGFQTGEIAKALEQLGSDSTLNFLNAFQTEELYYRDAVEKLRGNGISCPKHDKLAKLCDVEFTRMGIDLEHYKILDRVFSPDRSTGAPGYTYYLKTPGIRFGIRSEIEDIEPIIYQPKNVDWQNAEVTASQISTLRSGIVIGPETA